MTSRRQIHNKMPIRSSNVKWQQLVNLNFHSPERATVRHSNRCNFTSYITICSFLASWHLSRQKSEHIKLDVESEKKPAVQRRDVIIRRDSGAICGLLLRNIKLCRLCRSFVHSLQLLLFIHLIYRYIVRKVIRKIVYSILISNSP